MTPQEAKASLLEGLKFIYDLRLQGICKTAIEEMTDGYGAKSHHHNYPGGLLVHVNEVFSTCLGVMYIAGKLNGDVLLTSAILHDWMKIQDYKEVDGKVEYTKYKEQIYYVNGSAIRFAIEAAREGIEPETRDAIIHCILSHHGREEWGSPVTPKTPEALTLHYADCMSAWFENGGYKEK